MINIPREVQLSGNISEVKPVSFQEKAQLFSDMAKETQNFVGNMQARADENATLDFENYATTQTRDIYEKNKLNPAALQKEYTSLFNGLSKNATGEQYKKYRNYFDNVSNSYIQKATNNYNAKQNDELKINTLQSLNEQYKILDDLAPLALNGTSEQRYSAGRSIADSINRVKSLSSATDVNGQYLLDPASIANSADKAKGVLISSGINQAFETSTNKEDFLRKFKAGEINFDIPTDDGSVVQINTKHELNNVDYARLEESMTSSILKQYEQNETLQSNLLASQAAKGINTIDPTNEKNKKALDKYFNTMVVPEMAQMNDIQRTDKIIEFTNNTGYIPASLQQQIKASVLNGNNEGSLKAANLVNNIIRSSPKTSWQLDNETMSEAVSMAYDIESGLKLEDIIKNRDVRRSIMANPEQKKFYNDKLHNEKIDYHLSARNALDESWFSEPIEAPMIEESSKLAEDYRRLFSNNYYSTGGNKDAAEKITENQFRKLYGVSEAGYGGKGIMRFSPERYYFTNEIPDYSIKQDMRSFVGNKALKGEDVFLVSDVKTEKEASLGKPTYMMMKENSKGIIEPILGDDNLPLRFAPRIEEKLKELGINEVERKKKKLQSARNKREIEQIDRNINSYRNSLALPFGGL